MKNHKYSFSTSRQQVKDAYLKVKGERNFTHTDSPTEQILVWIRDELAGDNQLLSLHWLRNEVVKLRKDGEFKGA